MKIMVTGGGTAGHVTPLLAVASEIKKSEPKTQIRYIGEHGKDNLNGIVKNSADFDKSYRIFSGKLRRFHGKKLTWYISQPGLLLRNLRDIFLISLGLVESFFILLFWRPNVLFSKGGYVSLPVGLAAAFLRIPIVTHDSDTLPGLTNRILSRYATKIGVGQPLENYKQYPKNKLVFCGVPVKADFANPPSTNESKAKLGINAQEQLVAVIGGSLGAVRLNKAVQQDLVAIATNNRVLFWLSGYHHFEELNEYVKQAKIEGRVIIEPFSHQADVILNAADVVVSRTGATFLAELAALSKATILVPNPLLTGGHQLKNAEVYSKHNAAIVIQESDLKNQPKKLADAINKILNNRDLKSQLEKNMSKFAVPDSAAKIADLILNVGAR